MRRNTDLPLGLLIRTYRTADEPTIIELSLRAWTPVFASLEATLGPEIFTRLHSDWRVDQAAAVRRTLHHADATVWVAEIDLRPAGFAAAILHVERKLGEIAMLAVDPVHQRQGIGRSLMDHATEWLRDAGMRVALVETGGDPGHRPARSVYERGHYVALPVARYFKAR